MRRRGVLPAAAAAAAAGSAAIASESGGFGGNAAYAARLDAVAPSGQSLGRLAAQLRQSLGHAVPQLRRSLAQARAAVRQVQQAAASGAAGSGSRGPLMLLPGSAAATHPLQCAQSPVGPVTVAAVDVRPALLKFGPELPLAVLPLPLGSTPPPNSVLVYRDSRPAPGSSAAAAGAGSATDATAATCLAVALHRATWRQLDAMYGPDLAAAI
ncbi:hypothetical protein HYH02_010357 [Chlamydomonas schloesseri]|uniref:Uncharacterized protein n=1 Tax=Chlamydomonas schloesseri TaxID=2026947 RepID=A0A835TC32_9CHLO|nr:hypothetical protein HYH02_010357 [Chlamydomonas schloesseri]|eukprot:KAG2440478.1 hypothetical protein HYH02_010357 [Chlamydomonas schloesseri]